MTAQERAAGSRLGRRNDPDRRDRIIDACLEVISQAGVAGTSHRKVAAQAAVPLGALTYYFDGMDDLLRQAFTRFGTSIGDRFERRMAAAVDADAARQAVAATVLEDFGDDRELVLSHELYTLAAREPAYRSITTDWMERSRSALERHFDPPTARMLDALIEGLTIHRALDFQARDPREVEIAVARLTTAQHGPRPARSDPAVTPPTGVVDGQVVQVPLRAVPPEGGTMHELTHITDPLAATYGSAVARTAMTLEPGEPHAGPWSVLSLAELVERLDTASAAPVDRPRIVAIDGRGGAGKSTLVEQLRAMVPSSAVVHTDDVAWHHAFFDWADLLAEHVLEPLHRGQAVDYRPRAWQECGRPGSITAPAGLDTVWVEGTGIIRSQLASLLDASIWVQVDRLDAQRRLLCRDGDAPEQLHLVETWACEENSFMLHERPWAHASLIVAGSPVLGELSTEQVAVAEPIRQEP